MHLPYLQVANELVELTAPDVAVILGAEECRIGWGLLKLIRWALERCPDNAPPSEHDIVKGPHAAKLIARAAGCLEDPEAFVTACESVAYPLLERVPEGIRVRGLDRYDGAWGKNHATLWKIIQARRSGLVPESKPSSPEAVPEPERNRSEVAPEPEHQTQTQTQTQTHIQTQIQKPKEEERQRYPFVYEAPTSEPDFWSWSDFLAFFQSVRQDAGLVAEAPPSERAGGTFWSEALMTPGVTPKAMKEAVYAFGRNKHWASSDPPFPIRAFMKRWRDFVRMEAGRGIASQA